MQNESDAENRTRSEARRALDGLDRFVAAAAPALEHYAVLYAANIEINRLVGILNNQHPKRPLSEEDADRLYSLCVAIEVAFTRAYEAHQAMGYLERHRSELGEMLDKLARLAAYRTSEGEPPAEEDRPVS
jgi:hypothetical protein